VKELRGLSEVDNRNEYHLGELEGSYCGAPTLRRNAPIALKSCDGLRFGAILMCREVIMCAVMLRK
jgi:hypothetical protein